MKAPPEAGNARRSRAAAAGPRQHRLPAALLVLLAAVPGTGLDAQPRNAPRDSAPGTSPDSALIQYRLELTANQSLANGRIRIVQRDGTVDLLELRQEGNAVQILKADGRLGSREGRLQWIPPARGGELHYRVNLERRRNNGAHDALVGRDFALFRGDDAFPVARLRYRDGAVIAADVAVTGPAGWSTVLPYRGSGQDRARVRNPHSGGSRPVGWIMAGELGVRRERINGVNFSVAAPRGQRVERLGMLALLRWNLAALMKGLPPPPDTVSIVSAGTPFWLGALSAPNSLYVHRDRPLISENGTSTLLHEMAHILLTPLDTAPDQDWIDEGLAEYLSLRALATTGTISPRRRDQALAGFERRGAGLKSLRATSASGPVTARAVTIFHNLDREIREASDGRQDLTDLVATLLVRGKPVDATSLRAAALDLLGRPARSLGPGELPGLDPL